MKPKSVIQKGSLGKKGKCNFCGNGFVIGNPKFGFRRKYCSGKCIKKRWERDNKKEMYAKALLWRRSKGMLPAGKSAGEEFIFDRQGIILVRIPYGKDVGTMGEFAVLSVKSLEKLLQ